MGYDDEDYHGDGDCPGSHGPSSSGGSSRPARSTAAFTHAASPMPRTCPSSKNTPPTHTHTGFCCRMTLMEPTDSLLLLGELLSTHIPPPFLRNPMGVSHIWVCTVLGATPGISISSSPAAGLLGLHASQLPLWDELA